MKPFSRSSFRGGGGGEEPKLSRRKLNTGCPGKNKNIYIKNRTKELSELYINMLVLVLSFIHLSNIFASALYFPQTTHLLLLLLKSGLPLLNSSARGEERGVEGDEPRVYLNDFLIILAKTIISQKNIF